MTKSAPQKIVIIGCGNVAWHLAKHLHSSKRFSVFVYNHKPNPGLKDFSSKLKCEIRVGLDDLINDADFYFICVSDKYISGVSKKIKCEKQASVILHTSGSAKIQVIKSKHENRGVFYPLQTFSKKDLLNWNEVPLILETSNAFTKSALGSLAKQFSGKTIFLDYRQRLRFHTAAVLVNNFANALYVAASEIIDKNKKNEGFKLLLPLIRQTTAKLERLAPIEAQTGPAKRKDSVVMKKHLAIISKQAGLKKIYNELSKLILKQQSHA